jgi:hypothetical protein
MSNRDPCSDCRRGYAAVRPPRRIRFSATRSGAKAQVGDHNPSSEFWPQSSTVSVFDGEPHARELYGDEVSVSGRFG